MTPGAGGRWFVLDIDEKRFDGNVERFGVYRDDGFSDGIVRVERARGDCCGCCGNPFPRVDRIHSLSGERWGSSAGTQLVGGAVAFLVGLLGAALLVVVVWSLDSYGSDLVSVDLGSGLGFVSVLELGSYD